MIRVPCSVQSCSEPAMTRGMCRRHYRAWRAGVFHGPRPLRVGERMVAVASALIEAEGDAEFAAARSRWNRLVRVHARRLVARWLTRFGAQVQAEPPRVHRRLLSVAVELRAPRTVELVRAADAAGLDVSIPRNAMVLDAAEEQVLRLGMRAALAACVAAAAHRKGQPPVPLAYLVPALRGASTAPPRGMSDVGTDWTGKLEV